VARPARAITGPQIVNVINAKRRANGLPPVREDPALSAGCAAYDNYRRINGGVEDGFTPGAEQPSKPSYTTTGARASRDSLLNAGAAGQIAGATAMSSTMLQAISSSS
jgi:hypothetical protein